MCVGTVDDVKQSNSNTTAHKQAGRLRVNLYIYIYLYIYLLYNEAGKVNSTWCKVKAGGVMLCVVES